MKTWKNCPKILLIIDSNLFFHYCQPGQISYIVPYKCLPARLLYNDFASIHIYLAFRTSLDCPQNIPQNCPWNCPQKCPWNCPQKCPWNCPQNCSQNGYIIVDEIVTKLSKQLSRLMGPYILYMDGKCIYLGH